MENFEIKEINGYRYAVCDNLLLDTVPSAFADEWLGSAPLADTLVLCSADPFPESVRAFAKKHPEGRIIAPSYTAFMLSNILGNDINIEKITDKRQLDRISLTAVSRAGKGSFLKASDEEELLWSGAGLMRSIEPVSYERATAVIAYVAGCNYTEVIARKIAEGIQASGNVDARLIDLCSVQTDDVIAACANAQGVLIGTSAQDDDAPKEVWKLITAMKGSLFAGKIAGVFGSGRGDSRAQENVSERLKQISMNVQDVPFVIQYIPDEAAMDSVYEYGYDFGCRMQNVPNTHRSKLVKCLVCGEIFDASLGVCPVCGVGMDKCVPVEEEVINHKEDTDRTYLCVGGGIASLSAAEAIRRRDKTGRIIMVSAETNPPVNRPMLTKNIAVAAKVAGSIDIKEADWFSENQIELKLGTSVVTIDPACKRAVLPDGSELDYDRLIYAAGAECFVPPFKGAERENVITIRHLEDVQKVMNSVGFNRKAVVIGAGVLGLEAAAELKRNRMDVTVLESEPRPMGRQLDTDTSDAVTRAAAGFGISILTGVNTSEISDEGVVLSDGTVIPADIVVVSCGVRANLDAAKSAGVDCGRSVIVNKYMETNVPDIYAAGDCAEFAGVNYQLWAEATEQGRVAGANAAGDRAAFVSIPLGASFEGMNTALYAIGDVGKQSKEYRKVEYYDEVENAFRKYWFAGGKLVGGILFGNTQKIPFLNDAIEKQSSYYSIKENL